MTTKTENGRQGSQPERPRFDTVVVGGGLAGLVAANLVADRGRTVLLVESRHRLGGRAATDEREGHLLNQGPHAFYLHGPGLAVLRHLGVDPAGGRPPITGSLAWLEGGLGVLPRNARSLATTGLLSPGDKVAAGRLLGTMGRLDPRAVAGRSAEDWITGLTDRPRVRHLVRGVVRLATYGADLDLLAADVALHQVQLGGEGVLYADGGWQRLIDRLADRLRLRGGHIATGAAVGSLTPTGDGTWTVTLAPSTGTTAPGEDAPATSGPADGGPADATGCGGPPDGAPVAGEVTAAAVILAGLSPAAAVRLTGSADLARRCEGLVPMTAATLDIGLRRLPRPDQPFALGLDRPWYLSVHNPPADLGPGATLHAMAYLDRHDTAGGGGAGARALRAELEALVDQVQPGWRDELVTARFQRHLVVAHALPTAATGGLAGRPPVAVADRPGVLLAGDWVGATGHLADAVIASAAEAAEAAEAAVETAAARPSTPTLVAP